MDKESPNKKTLEKPNTQQYRYFTSKAKIRDKTYAEYK